MTRARNRRRSVPLHPATTGTFQPIKDPAIINGADCKNNGSVEKGDYGTESHHSQHAANAGNQRLEEPQISKKDGNGRRSPGHISTTCPHHHHHHQHQHQHQHQHNQGKESSDLRKNLASSMAKHQGDDGKASPRSQEYTPYMAARAKELKEEGNRRFQQKEYSNAMDHYELALKLTPPQHPDRAIFHSNRAACLMQMKPVQYDAAINECNLALHAQPGFPRALLRRARAFEAVGKLDLALQDIELLLQGDVSHPDAIDMAKRIRLSMENQGDEVQPGDQGTQSTPPHVKTCADATMNVSSESRELHSATRSVGKERRELNTVMSYDEDDHGAVLTPCPSRHMQTPPRPSSQQAHMQTSETSPLTPAFEVLPRAASLDFSDSSKPPPQTPPLDSCKSESLKKVIHQDNIQILQIDNTTTPNMRPLKLIYDHDIRLAEMPVNCRFGDLRKLVRERFPSSKAILIKYKDAEGDLVTITSTQDLRLAEAAAAIETASRSFRMANMEALSSQDQHTKSALGLPVVPSSLDQLRLHVVEVPGDQEPYDKDEVDEDSVLAKAGTGKTETVDGKVAAEEKAKTKGNEDFDKWLLDFAQLFRSHLGIDPNGHIDLQDQGMELCAEALEEAVSTEEAHELFAHATSKFQEMVALGFLNWGNVYMCAARKQLPHDSDDGQLDFCDRLQAAFDWAQAQYALAEEKFGQSICVKPDFCDTMLSLGQKDFESAKLHWSLAIAKQMDLGTWDSSEMLKLFRKAEDTMQEAAEMLEKQECTTKDVRPSLGVEKETEDASILQGSGAVYQKSSTFEQDVALKLQVYLFWGNILYEHSQVEFRLGLPSWKELLDAAVQKFEVAGASPLDITTALQKHLSSSTVFIDAMEGGDQQQGSEGLDPKVEKMLESEENARNSTGSSDHLDENDENCEGRGPEEDAIDGRSMYDATEDTTNYPLNREME